MFHPEDYPQPQGFAPDWLACYHSFLLHLWEHSHSEHTVENYAGSLSRFFNATDKPSQAITRQDVMAYASRATLIGPIGAKHADGPPPSARTHNHRVAIVASFYDWACGYETTDGKPIIDRNPAQGVRPTRESPTHRLIPMEHFERLIAVIPKDTVIGLRDRAIFLMLFWSTRRREELVSLTYGSLSPTTFIDAKTHETRAGWKYTVKVKGGSSITAEMPAPAMAALQAYIDASGRHMEADSPLFESIGPAGGGFVRDPFLGLSSGGLYERMKHYVREAGLPGHAYSPHSIRHLGGLSRYRAGSGLLEIQHTLNHKNVRTTQIYVQELDVSQDTGALLLLEQYGSL